MRVKDIDDFFSIEFSLLYVFYIYSFCRWRRKDVYLNKVQILMHRIYCDANGE